MIYFIIKISGKPKMISLFLSHQMQIVHTIIFGGGEMFSSNSDASELIMLVRYRVRDSDQSE